MKQYGVTPQTVVNAINSLRAEGLVVGLTGSDCYVLRQRPVMRMARTRLSRAERAAGRGAFTTEAHTGGWSARVDVDIRTERAGDIRYRGCCVRESGSVETRRSGSRR